MPKQKINETPNTKKAISKLKKVEKGYLNIIENTLKSFKDEKREYNGHLDDIENLLELYKIELEHIDQINKEMHDNLLKLIEDKRFMRDKIEEDLKMTDVKIQSIQRKYWNYSTTYLKITY